MNLIFVQSKYFNLNWLKQCDVFETIYIVLSFVTNNGHTQPSFVILHFTAFLWLLLKLYDDDPHVKLYDATPLKHLSKDEM